MGRFGSTIRSELEAGRSLIDALPSGVCPVDRRDFTFHDGERVLRFGAGCLGEAAGLIADRGLGDYALLTTERALAWCPAALTEGARSVVQVARGPVPAAAAAARERVRGRPLVALGGGRVVDVAKAIAAADGLRCAAIPTTLAGSSFTPFHRMPAGVEGYGSVRPALAVCDPALMASSPMPGLAATAMNALAHAVESLYAPGANPVAEGAALRAASLLPPALSRDPPGAEELSLCALLAGWSVGTTGLAVHHAVCQTIVRETGAPHAETNALLLAHSIRFMSTRAPEAIARLAAALGAPAQDPAAAADVVARLASLAQPRPLSELGVGGAELDRLVTSVLRHPAIENTPGDVSEGELRGLLRSAL